MSQPIKKLVIAGGGLAGWMAAAYCRKMLPQRVAIELVESQGIDSIDVDETSLPNFPAFNDALGLDERDFLRVTQGCIKLGTCFEHWQAPGASYFHTYGMPGANLGFTRFYHYWLRARQRGLSASIWDYDLNYLCSQAGVLGKVNSSDPIYQIPYGYHFDAALYSRYLRQLSEGWGVICREDKIQQVQCNPDTGEVETLWLESGAHVNGDFFLDCTGASAHLIQGALNAGFEDWSHWLPCNRVLVVASESVDKTLPYTRVIAQRAGWQWCAPLVARNSNGLVFSTSHLSEDEATHTLVANLEREPVGNPRMIQLRSGRSCLHWHKNVVALGQASGWVEPLESTGLHLIQYSLERLLQLFPGDGISPHARDQFNSDIQAEYEAVRDFTLLHYYLNSRSDTDFWAALHQQRVPERLSQKVELFKSTGLFVVDPGDVFGESSWLQVMLGSGVVPTAYHSGADGPSEAELREMLQRLAAIKRRPIGQFLPCDEFLSRYLASK